MHPDSQCSISLFTHCTFWDPCCPPPSPTQELQSSCNLAAAWSMRRMAALAGMLYFSSSCTRSSVLRTPSGSRSFGLAPRGWMSRGTEVPSRPGLCRRMERNPRLDPCSTSSLSSSLDYNKASADCSTRLFTFFTPPSSPSSYNSPVALFLAYYRTLLAVDGLWPALRPPCPS